MLHIDKKGQNDEKDKDSSDIYNHNSNHFGYYSMFIHQALYEFYMISTQETERMKKLAGERLPYMLNAAQNPENTILIKIALDIDEEFREEQNDYEHIWFELLETSEKDLTAKLTQEPYYVKDMHVDSIGTYPFERITDWIIYTKERRLTPDDAYLMECGIEE